MPFQRMQLPRCEKSKLSKNSDSFASRPFTVQPPTTLDPLSAEEESALASDRHLANTPVQVWEDNRPDSIAQQNLQALVHNSPQARRAAALQEVADNSSQVRRLAEMQEMVNNSPRMVAQRKQLESMFTIPGQRQRPAQAELTQNKFNAKVAPAELKGEPTPLKSNAGLPDDLKAGIEELSGISMDDVQVHYNSSKPAGLLALACTHGTEIHVGPSQEKYLAHEAWHVVQQAQGRVKPTAQANGVPINNEPLLEREAETMGSKATVQAKRGERQRNDDAKPVRGNATAQPGLVVQCVGGRKYGLRRIAEVGNKGLDLLIAAEAKYKNAMKAEKEKAMEAFKGHEGKTQAQAIFSEALRQNEMTLKDLPRYLPRDSGLRLEGDKILYENEEVAQYLEGTNAYEQISGPINSQSGEFIQSAVYKRHRLKEKNPLAPKEYVRLNDMMIRRYAHRGITPLELKALKAEEKQLVPLNWENRTKGEKGYWFDKKGQPIERKEDSGVTKNDLDFLNYLRDANFEEAEQIRDDPTLLAFLQTRKGVNKMFSARSTEKPITSNHGKSFSAYGEIEIDLAKVQENFVLHHYNARPFQENDFGEWLQTEEMRDEIARANETVTRNREIVLSKIPREAVTKLTTEGNKVLFSAVKSEFEKVFRQEYESAYMELLLPKRKGKGKGKSKEKGSKDEIPEPKIPSRFPFSIDAARKNATELAKAAAKAAAKEETKEEKRPEEPKTNIKQKLTKAEKKRLKNALFET